MVITNIMHARFAADGVVQVHAAAAGDEKNVAHPPICEPAGNVIRKLHRRAASEVTLERTCGRPVEFEPRSESTGLLSPS